MRKRKRIKRYQLKRKYKRFVKAQMECKVRREFYLITEKDANMMSLYLPPLTKTDKLFDESFPRSIPSYSLIEEGYANCALLLLNSIILSNDNLVHDTYIFPALFCFRHYLELTIKTTLKEYGLAVVGHNLSSLFENLRPYLSIGEEVDNVNRLLHEFDEVDSSATTFRYSFDVGSSGNVKVKEFNHPINVFVLRKRFLQLYSFFDGVLNQAVDSKKLRTQITSHQ